MKYWYLEKYKDIKITEINALKEDLKFFITSVKIAKKEAEELLTLNINKLKEEELLILLNYILYYKLSALNKIILIINKLLEIPDNSMPITNYTLEEMFFEIKDLKNTKAEKNKLQNNNIAACFNCTNVFYIDKIIYTNKKNICLCPFCKKANLYFDNDYIPMDFYFLKFANLYYKKTPLGCNFKNLQKLLKRNVNYTKNKESIILKEKILKNTNIFKTNNQITSKEQMQVLYAYYTALNNYDLTYNFNLTIEVPNLSGKNKTIFALFLLIFLTTLFGENIYLKKVYLDFKTPTDVSFYKNFFKNFSSFL